MNYKICFALLFVLILSSCVSTPPQRKKPPVQPHYLSHNDPLFDLSSSQISKVPGVKNCKRNQGKDFEKVDCELSYSENVQVQASFFVNNKGDVDVAMVYLDDPAPALRVLHVYEIESRKIMLRLDDRMPDIRVHQPRELSFHIGLRNFVLNKEGAPYGEMMSWCENPQRCTTLLLSGAGDGKAAFMLIYSGQDFLIQVMKDSKDQLSPPEPSTETRGGGGGSGRSPFNESI